MTTQSQYLTAPKVPPSLDIPASYSTVTVRIIDNGSRISCPTCEIAVPPIKGHNSLTSPVLVFLISNGKRHILYDLGTREDWQNLPSAVHEGFKEMSMSCTVDKDVSEILDDDEVVGIKSTDIEAIVWSHHHWDHTGNPSLFPSHTTLIVGPGFEEEELPCYPEDPDSPLPMSDFESRSLHELSFDDSLKIGGLNALDYFGDGSFYLLNTPGHTSSHLSGLARTTCNPETFILMGGDASDLTAKMRPSKYMPLPTHIDPSPLKHFAPGVCPGEVLQKIQRNQRADEPFYLPSADINEDEDLALETQEKLIELDGLEQVWTVLAHDDSLLGKIELFPQTVNDWKARGLGERTRWAFLADFEGAVVE